MKAESPMCRGDLLLVAGTDGMGTKLKIAFNLSKHVPIGIDLTAMSAKGYMHHRERLTVP